MVTLSQLTELLGWVAIINIGVLVFTTLILLGMSQSIKAIHRSLFGLSDSDLSTVYFSYLALYKVLTLIFVISPYCALKLMGQ
jgi:choline-glycine betaine transporter